MRAIIQRVVSASVMVDTETVGAINKGFLVLLGVEQDDAEVDGRYLADKTIGLRVFPDSQGKMNLDIVEIGGEVLVVSQFTLLGDCRKGRRPAFTAAAQPDLARCLYEDYCEQLRQHVVKVQQGIFAADMKVHLVNDGPVTLMLDSRKRF
ncbi:MAG: D-aminoacyl-tRNA deacylase [Pirellulaceae bacterium]